MPSQDFVYDLLEKLKEDNMDYLLITVNKGKASDQVELFYDAETAQSEQSMIYCFNKVVEEIQSGDLPDGELKEIDYGVISQDEIDSQPLEEEDDDHDED